MKAFYVNNSDKNYPDFSKAIEAFDFSERFGGEVLIKSEHFSSETFREYKLAEQNLICDCEHSCECK